MPDVCPWRSKHSATTERAQEWRPPATFDACTTHHVPSLRASVKTATTYSYWSRFLQAHMIGPTAKREGLENSDQVAALSHTREPRKYSEVEAQQDGGLQEGLHNPHRNVPSEHL